MSGHTIGIDIGTTGTKTVLFDTGPERIVATATRETALHSPGPGIAEADTEQWRASVVESIREVLTTSGVAPADVGALVGVGHGARRACPSTNTEIRCAGPSFRTTPGHTVRWPRSPTSWPRSTS